MLETTNIKKKLTSKNIVLVGAGQLGQMALELWPKNLNPPIVILDKIKQGSLLGVPIEKFENHHVAQSNIYVLSYFKESAERVKALFSDVFNQELITVYDLLTSYLPNEFSNGWIGDPKIFQSALKNIRCFNDETSKDVYSSAVQWRYLRKLTENYPVGPESEKYTLTHYGISERLYDFIIDAGSYDFSFPLNLWSSGIRWNSLIALEPDSKTNVKTMMHAENLKEKVNSNFNFRIDTRALWTDSNGCNFYSNGLLSARVANCKNINTSEVPSISLDSLLTEIGATQDSKILIKMHIEGAEWPVIDSSRELIKDWRGIDFLINVSHDENSLVKIPALFHQLKKHDLIIRSHSLFGEGLTLCARSRKN
jgi:hypothetical protein